MNLELMEDMCAPHDDLDRFWNMNWDPATSAHQSAAILDYAKPHSLTGQNWQSVSRATGSEEPRDPTGEGPQIYKKSSFSAGNDPYLVLKSIEDYDVNNQPNYPFVGTVLGNNLPLNPSLTNSFLDLPSNEFNETTLDFVPSPFWSPQEKLTPPTALESTLSFMTQPGFQTSFPGSTGFQSPLQNGERGKEILGLSQLPKTPPEPSETLDNHTPCFMPFCSVALSDEDWPTHLSTNHPELQRCQECGLSAWSYKEIRDHAFDAGHASYACPFEDCTSTCARIDVFKRHLDTHRADGPRYPCPHCKKYRGRASFKRKDHLSQHIRNYHHIQDDSADNARGASCRYPKCEAFRPGAFDENGVMNPLFKGHAFSARSEYNQHLKRVHDEAPFSCPIPGCNRTGGKGYLRKRDLAKHQQKEHGNQTL